MKQLLAEVAPECRDRIVGYQVVTPADLERELSLTGGHIHHGEHGLDQLLSFRPQATCARYATPLKGLVLCGSGSHPGGGITAMGTITARVILDELGALPNGDAFSFPEN